MMKILGISDTSVCGGAALVEDGQVLASVSEECLDRQKIWVPQPVNLICA